MHMSNPKRSAQAAKNESTHTYAHMYDKHTCICIYLGEVVACPDGEIDPPPVPRFVAADLHPVLGLRL